MSDFIQIRSVKQYFNDFIVEGLKNNQNISQSDILMIKNQILDAFRKEIFEQIAFKLGPEAANKNRDELAALDTVQNILKNEFRKWKRLCIVCSEHGMGGLFNLEDLRRVLDEQEDDPQEIVYGDDPGEDVTEKMAEVLPEGEQPVYLDEETRELKNDEETR